MRFISGLTLIMEWDADQYPYSAMNLPSSQAQITLLSSANGPFCRFTKYQAFVVDLGSELVVAAVPAAVAVAVVVV